MAEEKMPATFSMLQEISAEKALPQNLEAERSVLGSVLLDPASLSFVVPILRQEDFFPDTHRRIYEAMLELFQRSSEIDVLTLKEELERAGAVEKVGGASYLSALLDAVPDVANVEHYARIVKEKSTLRRLIRAGQRMVREGLSQEKNAEVLLGDITGEIFDIAEDAVSGGFTPIGEIVKHNLEILEDARNRQGMLSGLASGFTELDRLTSGLQPTDLVILAARPSVGKTSLALNIAQHVAFREARSVGFFSLEMSKEQIGFRVLCSEADVDAKKVRDGYASKEATVRLVTAQSKIAGADFFLDDSAALNVPEMRAKAQRLKRERGLDLLVVDYLQLMAGHGRFDNRTQEVSQISRGLKLLAKELRVPILALSQLSRQPEQRKGELRKPQLADLRDSGCLTADTRVLRADTGRETTMGELLARREHDIPVWTLDSSMRLVPGAMTHVFASGIKPVFEMRLASGRVVKASANHPFLTLEGWSPLERLKTGDRLAVPRQIPEPSQSREWPDPEVVLLAHLLGEGSFTSGRPMHYTSSDFSNIATVEVAARRFGIRARRVAQESGWQLFLSAPFRLSRRRNPLADWLDRFHLNGCRREELFIPQEIFQLSRRQIGLFVRHLWAEGGSMQPGWSQADVSYASTSRRFVEDLQALLLRFRILTRIREGRKAAAGPPHRLHIHGTENQRVFFDEIGVHGSWGRKAEQISRLLGSAPLPTGLDILSEVSYGLPIASSGGGPYGPPDESFGGGPDPSWAPVGVWGEIKSRLERRRISHRAFPAGLSLSDRGGGMPDLHAASRARGDAVAALVDEPPLQALAESDVFWDRIAGIEPRGEQPVFDASVPGTHNFIANGVFAHNSLEQDADVVIFLYREELYDRDTERKGIADVIIAKQRNGPTGDFPLVFLADHMTFANYAGPALAPEQPF